MTRRDVAAAAAATVAALVAARRLVGPARDPQAPVPAREPRALGRLAGWEPAPPSRRATRAAAYAWAAPISVWGLIAGAASGVRPHVRDGVLLFPGVGGLTGAVLRRSRYAAGTFGHVVVARGDPDPGLLAHELMHTRQAERLGPLLAPVYLGLLAAYGYSRHPLERAARQRQANIGART